MLIPHEYLLEVFENNTHGYYKDKVIITPKKDKLEEADKFVKEKYNPSKKLIEVIDFFDFDYKQHKKIYVVVNPNKIKKVRENFPTELFDIEYQLRSELV